MDNTEYTIKKEEIRELIAQREYAAAAEIADTIDWRKVRSVMMLCTVSDLYKINRRYEDAKNLLLLAYDIKSGGRAICYSLCELCIKTEEFVQAVKYYKEFIQAAPRDPDRYVLQYKLYEAQDVSLEERIEVLKELKKRDYREKWAYELAYLYHRIGQATLCVEECDELILWFGEGRYVYKAMELKMLHQPLSASQQEKYDHRFDSRQKEEPESRKNENTPAQETWQEASSESQPENRKEVSSESQQEEGSEAEIQVKTVDVGQYNTINLQAELAAGLQEVLGREKKQDRDAITRSIMAPMLEPEEKPYEKQDIPSREEVEGTEVFFGETGEIGSLSPETLETVGGDTRIFTRVRPEDVREQAGHGAAAETDIAGTNASGAAEAGKAGTNASGAAEAGMTGMNASGAAEAGMTGMNASGAAEAGMTGMNASGAAEAGMAESGMVEVNVADEAGDETAEQVMNQLRQENTAGRQAAMTEQPPRELAGVLSQEADGQISLVVPEKARVEKQITGQMNIQDILTEWERMKRENEERRKEEVRQHVLEQTGSMFTEFEVSVRDKLLEQLESTQPSAEQEMKEAEEVADAEEKYLSEHPEAARERAARNEEMEEQEEESQDLSEEEQANQGQPEEVQDLSEEEQADLSQPEETQDQLEEIQELEEIEEVEELEEIEEQADQGQPEEAQDQLEEIQETEEIEEVEEQEEQAAHGQPEEVQDQLEEIQETEEIAEVEEIEEQADHSQSEEAQDLSEEVQNQPEEDRPQPVRKLTREEKELYAPFVQSRSAREQLVKAIDNISMAAYTGNIIVTGEEGMDTLTLAKNMIREVQLTDSNFSGKVAKISGSGLNGRNVEEVLEHFKSGALIIQKASGINTRTAAALYKALQQETLGIIIVAEDTKKGIAALFAANPRLQESFTARMDMEALSNDMLVSFGRQYAREKEYAVDDLGVLALHTRIEDMQTHTHAVTVLEVKSIVDEAIRHANKKTLKHFFDILFARRYDDEDMIILTEKDFV